MSPQESRSGAAWIEYVLASDDDTDRALANELRAQQWIFHETLQTLLAEVDANGLSEDVIRRQNEQRQMLDVVQTRVAIRGRELRAAGSQPVSEEIGDAWRAECLALRSDVQIDRDGISVAN